MTTSYGPATSLIDFGYAVKLPLSKEVDRVFGLEESDPRSLVQFLKVCYVTRRPEFEFWDIAFATYFFPPQTRE